MKSDRLYAITIYLMNHKRTSASALAKHFEVSVRTIQRDIDALYTAGIPVIAATGVNGGYEISEHFSLKNHLISAHDYLYIITALKGLSTATKNPQINNICEKINSLVTADRTDMLLDFSVLQEGNAHLLKPLQSAISAQKAVTFRYTNSQNETRVHLVEPIAVIYRWYAWYLLAYSPFKNNYRMYKLLRIDQLEITGQDFTREHQPAETILAAHDKQNTVTPTVVTVKCSPDLITKSVEYLNGKVIRYLDNQTAIMELNVIESEQLWLGTLLSFGDKIEILSPEHIKQKLITSAEKILSLYDKL